MKNSQKTEYLATMPMTARHYWIVFVASLGQFVGTSVATLAGILIPMINIIRHPELNATMQGLIGCMDLVGIIFGSLIFGRLSDRYGYLFFFRLCPALILVAAIVSALVPSVTVLIVCLFFIGLGIGGEYSLDSDYVSELMPVKYRSLMIGVTKAASALGNIIVAGLCYFILTHMESASEWPDMMWIVAAIAAFMLLVRVNFHESPRWLIDNGRHAAAEKATEEFLGKDVRILKVAPDGQPAPAPDPKSEVAPSGVPKKGRTYLRESDDSGSFFKRNFSRIVLSGIPWACEGLGVYGIGVFLPILVMALGLEHFTPGMPKLLHVASSVEITFFISCIILPGFIIGLWLIRRKMYIPRIQTVGFWVCAASLVVLLLAYHYGWNKWISIGSFMLFELFLNIGPHLVTYVLPAKIYPVADRGVGTGIAAAVGKVGAVLGVFFIPQLLHWGGAVLVLAVSAAVMALGAIVTQAFAPRVLPKNEK